MSAFLINSETNYSYSDLLSAVTSDNVYYPLFKTHDLFAYFTNFVKALVNNAPLVLLDADLSPAEIKGIDETEVNLLKSLKIKKFTSIADLIFALQQSSSKITIFTSGTTGQPKKVVHTVSTLTRSVRCGKQYQGQVWAYAYNPTHMAGLQVFFQGFENMSTLINVFNLPRNEVYRLIDKYSITHISATPTFYRLLLPFEHEYTTVQRVTLGGEKSEFHLYDNIRKIFPCAKINNVYASTEAGSLFAAKGEYFYIPEAIRDKIRIVDDELLIHSSLLGQSDSFKFDGGYYHSGDLIEWVDVDKGIFKFRSRKNELINVGGYKINPTEVEAILNSIEGIHQSLVYGKSNSVLGNIVCAEIQLEINSNITELDVRLFLREKLQDFKIPRRIKFVESFTLTRTGKLKRS